MRYWILAVDSNLTIQKIGSDVFNSVPFPSQAEAERHAEVLVQRGWKSLYLTPLPCTISRFVSRTPEQATEDDIILAGRLNMVD